MRNGRCRTGKWCDEANGILGAGFDKQVMILANSLWPSKDTGLLAIQYGNKEQGKDKSAYSFKDVTIKICLDLSHKKATKERYLI